jgi:TM2 domain-containing membrane protein YozV
MHCRNCGREVDPQAVACVGCGHAPLAGNRFCQHCGGEVPDPAAYVCLRCGVRLVHSPLGPPGSRSQLVAGLLGIFLGGLGVHRFYLGDTGVGVAQILVTFLTCGLGAVWGFIEGVLLLTGAIDRDAEGRPLGP